MIWAKILLFTTGLGVVFHSIQAALDTDDAYELAANSNPTNGHDKLSRVLRSDNENYDQNNDDNQNDDNDQDGDDDDDDDDDGDGDDDENGDDDHNEDNDQNGDDDESCAYCYASGDPHYKTFDQRYYDFQGNCEYVLTTPCISENFSVIVRNKACNTYVTCTEQVTVLVPSDTENLEIILGRGRTGTVTINDYNHPDDNDGVILQSTSVQVQRIGGRLNVLLINEGIHIFWDGKHRVIVKASTKWQGKLCGLCGNYNLDKTDDFQTPDGDTAETADSFGNSWLYNDGTSSGDETCVGLPNPPTCPEATSQEARDKCQILRQNTFNSCNGVINPDAYIASCEYDYCLCKEEDREDCYCDSLATYATDCAAAGVTLNWRNESFCSPQCPEGMTYQQCGSMCPQTCETDQNAFCTQGCAEGCFCPDGTVLDDDGNCIDPSQCSKCPDGMVYKHCGPSCPPTCGKASSCSSKHKNICNRGCFCPDGTVLNNGKCIEPEDCHWKMIDDPHFIVPLLSNEILCYSIQGYPGLAFNLISNKNFVINAHFVDSAGDNDEATWIGKLAVIPTSNNKTDAIIFDSVSQEVIMVNQGNLKAAAIDHIVFNKTGKMSIKSTTKKLNNGKNPTIRVTYEKPLANFNVTFYKNHLNVDWDIVYESVSEIYGLMGQFMTKNVNIDVQRQMLIYSDGRNPVPVIKDTVMSGRPCWKAMNFGHQGEGLIKGNILDYVLSNILVDNPHYY